MSHTAAESTASRNELLAEVRELTDATRSRAAACKLEMSDAATALRDALRAAEHGTDRAGILEQEVQTVLAAHLEGTAQGEVVAAALEREMQVAMGLRSELDSESGAAQRLVMEHAQAVVRVLVFAGQDA